MSDNADAPPEPEPLRTVQQLWDSYIARKRAKKGFARYDETKATKDAFYAGIKLFLAEFDAAVCPEATDRDAGRWSDAVSRELDTDWPKDNIDVLRLDASYVGDDHK